MKYPLLLWLCFPLQLWASSERFVGYAQDLESGRYLYSELHNHQLAQGCWETGTVWYRDAQGKLLASKQLDFRESPFLPLMRFRIEGRDYRDEIQSILAKALVVQRSRDGRIDSARVPRIKDQAADAGFHHYILAHLPELAAGKTVKLNFVVAGQGDQYRFRMVPVAVQADRVRLRVEPDTLLRWLVDPLLLDYSVAEQRLLQYEGASNLFDADGSLYSVRIVFSDTPPSFVPASAQRVAQQFLSQGASESKRRNCAIFSSSNAG